MVAQVQKQAPTFKKTAVVDGVFDEVSLDKYKGKYVGQHSFSDQNSNRNPAVPKSSPWCRKIFPEGETPSC